MSQLTAILNRLRPAPVAPELPKLASAQGISGEYIEKLAMALEWAADEVAPSIIADTPVAATTSIKVDAESLARRLKTKVALHNGAAEHVQNEQKTEANQALLQRVVARLSAAREEMQEGAPPVEEQLADFDPIALAIAEASGDTGLHEGSSVAAEQAAELPSASLNDVLTAALSAKGPSESTTSVESVQEPVEPVDVRDAAVGSAKTAMASGRGPVTVQEGSDAFKALLLTRRQSGSTRQG